MAGIEAGISAILAYAADNAHGYELRERDYDIGTDCAGLGRYYAAAVEGVNVGSMPDMHSWDIASKLQARGWQVLSFSEQAKRRGDILVRVDPKGGTGHVVVYLGDNRICGAEGDWDGRAGDGSGTEICERGYYSYGYSKIVRWPGEMAPERVTIETVTNGVYRLYNPNSGQHLFTADHSEAESLANSGWSFEGVPFRSGSGEPVWRLYNKFSGAHMLTADGTEGMDMAVAGWQVESEAFAQGSSRDCYRLYNKNNGDHVFTVDETERESLRKAGWSDEGAAFRVD